jgi:catechol 2,3-dioxygenase-like lactoylglutathione lyase family enzyme
MDKPSVSRVVGLGGVFLKACDPQALRAWYRLHLGLDIDEAYGGCTLPLNDPPQPGACSVFSIFGEDSRYLDPSPKPFMLNFRVADLTAVLALLRAEGCAVDAKEERSEYGNFGWVMDPEGHRIELWEPPAAGSTPT